MKFLESAKGIDHNQGYRYLAIVLITLIGGQLLGAIPLIILIVVKGAASGSLENGILDLTSYGVNSTTTLFLMMIPFIVSFIFYVLFFKPIHKRSWITTVNGTHAIRWNRFFLGFGLWGSFMLILSILSYLINPENFEVQFQIEKWIPLLLVSLIVIPLQTSYEELLFRGYLSQGVGSLTGNRWLVLIVPSVFFALMHSFNPEIEKYGFWITMPQYFVIGLTYTLISLLDDGIEIALGAHAVNNIFSATLANYEGGVISTDSILVEKNINPEESLIGLIISSAVFCFILSKKLKWNWSILKEKIKPISEG